MQANYREDMTLDEAILLAGKILKENLEQKINKDNVLRLNNAIDF